MPNNSVDDVIKRQTVVKFLLQNVQRHYFYIKFRVNVEKFIRELLQERINFWFVFNL